MLPTMTVSHDSAIHRSSGHTRLEDGSASTPPRVAPAYRPFWYAAVLAVLLAVAALVGILDRSAYAGVPDLLRETWRAQDMVNLVLTPVLLLAWRRALAGSLRAHLVVVGLLTWFAYCYAHLAFAAPFTPVFLVYVAILGMAGFGALDGLVRTDAATVAPVLEAAPRRAAGWFLVVAGVGIAGLWLSDIALGMVGGTPANLHLAALPNPTWVIDLGWLIPMAVAAGVALLRRRVGGPLLAAVLMVALTALSVAMLALTPVALVAGLGEDPVVAPQLVVFTVVFVVLGGIEVWLLGAGSRRMERPVGSWLRPGWWDAR